MAETARAGVILGCTARVSASANLISVPPSSAVLLRKRAITGAATSGIGTPFADDAIQQKQVVHIQAPMHDCCCNLPTGGDIEEGTEE